MRVLVALLMASSASAAPRYSSVRLDGIPHVRQRPDFCGEACVEMALKKLGSAIDQNDVFAISGLDPALGRGVFTKELIAAVERIGFRPGRVWTTIPARGATAALEALWSELHADLLRGVPSIVCTRFDEKIDTTEHFRLIVGYDAARDQVLYHDPAVESGAWMRMPRARLFDLWPLKYDPERWTAIRVRLEPGQIIGRPAERPARLSAAEYSQHIQALRDAGKIPRGFEVLIEPPFVVIGDGAVERHARGTVRWAVKMLKQDFFARDPDTILGVWLLAGPESYARATRILVGEEPSTPYGFFSESAGALIMNIATGGGTLVHEIVHPFMHANFPDAPPWYNEGLGSLYEQSGEEGGHIVGYTNWRLEGLKRAIRKGALPPFVDLLAMTSRQFYDEDRGDNYAQARYLLYYMQQKGLLRDFHRRYLRDHRADPTGVATLRAVLDEKDLTAFQRRWEKWVLTLSFDG